MPSSASNLTIAKRVEFRTRMLIGRMTAVGRLGLPAIFVIGPLLLRKRTFAPHRQRSQKVPISDSCTATNALYSNIPFGTHQGQVLLVTRRA